MKPDEHAYEGRDLESMAEAQNYHRWILSEFHGFIGNRILEVGAGAGSFSELLVAYKPDRLTLVEPSDEMFSRLESWYTTVNPELPVELVHGTLATKAGTIDPGVEMPDTIVYCNVLEHIEDDQEELETAHTVLAEEGKVLIFVPANMWLYGPFDKRIGHYRRYTKSSLESVVSASGFRILKSTWFDFFGMIPWFLRYRLLKSDSMPAGQVAVFDRYAVPVLSRIERLVRPPVGKNVLLVAEKV